MLQPAAQIKILLTLRSLKILNIQTARLPKLKSSLRTFENNKQQFGDGNIEITETNPVALLDDACSTVVVESVT